MNLIPRRRTEGSLPEEMSRLFEDFFSTGRSLMKDFWGNGHDRVSMFPVDIRETDDKVIVDAELPGVDPKDVEIKVEGNVLVIAAERKHEKEEKAKDFYRVERTYGRFQRQIELPWGADPEKAGEIALAKAGKSIDDVERVELNEAFSSVVVNSMKMLGADPEKVEATYKNGVLTIDVAKREEAKAKTIQVKVEQ